LLAGSDYEISLHLGRPAEMKPKRLNVSLNGTSVLMTALNAEQVVSVSLPSSLVRDGANELEFTADPDGGREADSGRRSKAFFLKRFRVERGAGLPAPVAELDAGLAHGGSASSE
jgi:hypothetical protein